jgi:diguanylate cyclase (GGDEF)-like protein
MAIRSRKQWPGLTTQNSLAEIAILSMPIDSRTLLRHHAANSLSSADKRVEDALQAVRLEANREFAKLLRDMRTESNAALFTRSQNRTMSELLMRAVRCAAKQYLLQAKLGNLALSDDLTGLYNRRGLMALAERQLKLGRRSGQGIMLIFIDVDGMKVINDSFGHSAGDNALKGTATALRMTFRDSDIIARIGGDEFAVLAIEASKDSENKIKARLFEHLRSIMAAESRYLLSLSLGIARFDTCKRISIGDLIAQADQAMYEQKRRRSRLQLDKETCRQSQ